MGVGVGVGVSDALRVVGHKCVCVCVRLGILGLKNRA